MADGGGRSITNRRAVAEDDVLYFMDGMSDGELLEAASMHFHLGLDDRERQQVHDIGRRREESAVATEVRAAVSVDEKILALAGEESSARSSRQRPSRSPSVDGADVSTRSRSRVWQGRLPGRS